MRVALGIHCGRPVEDDAGTLELWHDLKGELLESQKPKALLLEHGEESLLLRINLIRSAQKDISIQTFSWEFDEVGKFILWELIEANQQRGVKVKLLIDHMFNEHRPDLIAYLSTLSPDFEIKYFSSQAGVSISIPRLLNNQCFAGF